MRVISSGRGVEEDKKQTVCHVCGCFFEYDSRYDYQLSNKTYTETIWSLPCPECRHTIKTLRKPIAKGDFNKVTMEVWDEHQQGMFGSERFV